MAGRDPDTGQRVSVRAADGPRGHAWPVSEVAGDPRAPARLSYERKVAYPLFVAALMFIVGMVLALDVQSSTVAAVSGRWLIIISWAAFAADYAVGLYLSPRRSKYVATHVVQLVGILFPPVRILLMGRVVTVLTQGAKRKLGNRVRVYALYLTTLAVVIASMLVVWFERRDPLSNIHSLGDAFWWSAETVSTVGYGDYYPVTPGGRVIAVFLMVNGIALLSAVTATIATKVLEGDVDGESGEDDVSLIELRDQLRAIELQLAEVAASRGPAPGSAAAEDAGRSSAAPEGPPGGPAG